jgi:hypothetical protein
MGASISGMLGHRVNPAIRRSNYIDVIMTKYSAPHRTPEIDGWNIRSKHNDFSNVTLCVASTRLAAFPITA